LVTGATGTVGREVCAALLERGAEVRVGARQRACRNSSSAIAKRGS